jgi:uncharacterized membrane protein YgcG
LLTAGAKLAARAPQLHDAMLVMHWWRPLAAGAAMTAVVGSSPGVAGVEMQPPAAVVSRPALAIPALGSDEPMRQLPAHPHNAVDLRCDLPEPSRALDLINTPAARPEPAGTGAVRLPHSMAGDFFLTDRNAEGRPDDDLHGTMLAALITAVPSGEIIPPNPPQIPVPPPPTVEQIAPPPPIAAPPLPQQLPPPPQQEEPPAAVPSPGGANGSGGSGDGGGGEGGDGAGGPGGDGGDGPAAPLPTAAMPPGGVRLSP